MSIAIELRGVQAGEARLPDLFAPASRAVDPARSEFLPPGYLVPRRSFDVGPSARSVTEGQAPLRVQADDDEVLVLELADGGTLVTSAARLREALRRSHPELVAPDGTLKLEQLREAGAASRGDFGEAIGGLVSKVFGFGVGAQADDILLDAAREFAVDKALLGVSWLGTKALMWAVEKRLPRGPGLYAWNGGDTLDAKPLAALDARIAAEPQKHPLLIFLHGTASHTLGSFGDLRQAGRDWWGMLEQRFPGGIYGFEHRTLSESPIDNVLALLELLPIGAHLSLVSHSLGGLLGDLLCLAGLDEKAIARYRHDLEGTGDADPAEAKRVIAQLADAHAEQRVKLGRLAALLAEKRLVVQRYVRVACPAAGTKLASGNFDLFLSGLLSLVGKVPGLFGSPYYAAFKRVVIEIAKNRTNPRLVPGIEAMLPDGPLARLLRDAPVDGERAPQMAVIAGDIEGGGMLQRLGVLLVDHLLFERTDNDLVVDTPAMLGGIAPRTAARVRFDRGEDVSHFRYFENTDTRDAMSEWLLADDLAQVAAFRALPAPSEYAAALAEAAASRDVGAADRPLVVVLPGVMGTHLGVGDAAKSDRVWFDPLDIAGGGLDKIAWGRPAVVPEDLFGMFYGKLCKHLAASHRVGRFPYDWRQPLDVLADRLAQVLKAHLAISPQPIRLLAHSMGGLVVRACIHRHRDVMDAVMARDGARLVMLGTPNQGAYSMVANLIGKGDTLRTLVRLDLEHDMQQVLDIVAGFRGALQLLPKPGFRDCFQGDPEGGQEHWQFQHAETWTTLAPKVRDFWFGDGKVGRPSQQALDEASWLWKQDGTQRPSLPAAYEAKSVYVFGVAANTPCGLREVGDRLKLVGTTRGDGTVSWESGRIGGIGGFYYMAAEHGDLPSTEEHFPALVELLDAGRTERLPTSPPAVRAIEAAAPVTYDAGPPGADDADTAQRRLLGASPAWRAGAAAPATRRLEVAVRAMDLRFLAHPVLVGQYEHDPIAGPQALIDRELLDGELSRRRQLGFYPGPLGTALAVLRVPNEVERARDSLTGAVVTGLGSYEKALTLGGLTDAVRAGALRCLLHTVDVLGNGERSLTLASLLLGYNSSANLTVAASVEAIVCGVMEANALFAETTRLPVRIRRVEIVELYTDTATTAVYALRDLAPRLASEAKRLRVQLDCATELRREESARQRLYDAGGGAYWPRLVVSDADRGEDDGPRACGEEAGGASAARLPARPSRALLPERLRFLYVGQRARAESVVLQRQPGLVEMLVRGQLHSAVWQEDFGRMLFQLMVPHDFKDLARQIDRVVLVVDSYTANLPWELMLADDPSRRDADRRPMALRTAMVRQLVSSDYRRQVRQSLQRNALVIGNPSLEGFTDAFPGPAGKPFVKPPSLRAAEEEAQAVVGLLRGMRYEVKPVIGEDQPARNVLAALYEKPWRILHVSAHGVFDLPHADGCPRSGVLLSDGLLITAAEIASMELVPELVFLNCCHLGKVDSVEVRDRNKLAASVARELIQIGVRCVLVAGWAVNDQGAKLFGKAFYENLLQRGMGFGDAVFDARRQLWTENPGDITWGAFQAYGDPSWQAEPRRDGQAAEVARPFVSPDEMLDAIARLQLDFTRRSQRQSERDRRAGVAALDALLKDRCPKGWAQRPELQSALGAAWRDLEEWGRAREALLAAIGAEDKQGRVPKRDIEQLANVEARLGEKRDDVSLIETAIGRLEELDRLTAAGPRTRGASDTARTAERSSLLGSACKRLAGVQARRLKDLEPRSQEARSLREELLASLARSLAAYRVAATIAAHAAADPDPYHALNALALEALTLPRGAAERGRAADAARAAGATAGRRYAARHDAWDAVAQADAALVAATLDGHLARDGEAGEQALAALARTYADALAAVVIKPSQIDSIAVQMELLARIREALAKAAPAGEQAPLQREAQRLQILARHLRGARTVRPPDAGPVPPAGGEPPPPPAPAPKPPRARGGAKRPAPARRAKQ